MKINLRINLRENLRKYRRVIQLTRKPTSKEIRTTTKICGLGFIVVGLIGFFFYLLSVLGGG